MSEILEQFYPCPGCPFHNFSQVNQCEPKGETCRWLLSLYDKAEKWDTIEPMIPKITKLLLEARDVTKLLGLVTKPRGEEE